MTINIGWDDKFPIEDIYKENDNLREQISNLITSIRHYEKSLYYPIDSEEYKHNIKIARKYFKEYETMDKGKTG